MVFIFDECYCLQFGSNYDVIKMFFFNVQFFGFMGMFIFEENVIYRVIEGMEVFYKIIKDIFQKELYVYIIINVIDDCNVLCFYIDYFKFDGIYMLGGDVYKIGVVDVILKKYWKVMYYGCFNVIFVIFFINDVIYYYGFFVGLQECMVQEEEDYCLFNIVCVFLLLVEGNKDIWQIQEDLFQEWEDNKEEFNKKKVVLKKIIVDYNQQYGINYFINEFDFYYQDVQQCIKD